LRSLTLPVVALLCAPLALAAPKIEIDFRDDIDFGRFETYGFRDGTPARRDSAQERIVQAIDHELRSKGFVRVDSGPQVWVVTHALVDAQSLDELADSDYWEFVTGIQGSAWDYRAGTLVVDVVEAETRQWLWRGVVSVKIDGTMERALKKVDKAVAKLLREFPPR
jgi:hypothetical protein